MCFPGVSRFFFPLFFFLFFFFSKCPFVAKPSPGEELVACETVKAWLKRAKNQELPMSFCELFFFVFFVVIPYSFFGVCFFGFIVFFLDFLKRLLHTPHLMRVLDFFRRSSSFFELCTTAMLFGFALVGWLTVASNPQATDLRGSRCSFFLLRRWCSVFDFCGELLFCGQCS